MLVRGAALFLCLASLGACASAGAGGDDIVSIDAPGGSFDGPRPIDAPQAIDAPGTPIDAPTTPIDAPPIPIDAPPIPIDAPTTQTITLSQSASTVITTLNSVACSDQTFGYTRENSFYRVFRLQDFGVNTAFTANRVDVAIEEANAGTGTTQTIQVRVYTLTGTFILPNLVLIAGQTVTVSDAATLTVLPVTMSPPGLAPAGSTVVVEVFQPDGLAAGNIFYPGSNTAAETGPSYIRAPDCGAAQPATFASLGVPGAIHLVLTVTGTY